MANKHKKHKKARKQAHTKKTTHKKSKRFFSVKNLLKHSFLFALSLFLFAVGAGLLWVASLEIPSVHKIDVTPIQQTTKIYDRTGKIILFHLNENVRRTIIPLDQMSVDIKNATIAIEDDDFYKHKGVRPMAILRAVFTNIKEGGFVQGGSTITQQVIKNMLLTREKKISRKIKEWILALKLESYKSKDEILELYLNTVPYGGVVYGVEEAAKYFFGVSAQDLTLAQSAYLAALPQRPTYLSPYGPHKDELEARKNLVLLKMYENGFITREQYEEALQEKVEFIDQNQDIKAPHFVFFVKQYLEEKYGEDMAVSGGLKVITTLDYKTQQKFEQHIKDYVENTAKHYNSSNAAGMVINSRTGEILAMVGSKDFLAEDIDGQYNVVTARRQPGSSFKPIVYSLLFEKGYPITTVLFDLATQFSTSCPVNFFGTKKNCYAPKNWDNTYKGPMTIKSALAQSRNIPAVKALYLAGIKDSFKHAKKLGIDIPGSADRYGFSFVLGTAEVSLFDMIYAYGAFSNGGYKVEPQFILEIKDTNDVVLEKFEKPKKQRVLETNTSAAIAEILSDVNAKIPTYGPNSPLYYYNHKIASKTGTTNSFKDLLVIGFSPDHVVGVWTGNNDNTPVANKFAGELLAPLWRKLMDETINRYGIRHSFPEYAAPETTKPILNGVWQINTNKGVEVHNILHYVDKNNPLGEVPKNPFDDPQYTRWEYSVALWSGQLPENPELNSQPNIQPPQSSQTNNVDPQIVTPSAGQTVPKGRLLNVSVAPSANLKKVEYYLNEVFIGASTKFPFSMSVIPNKIGPNKIEARMYKQDNTIVIDWVNFNVK